MDKLLGTTEAAKCPSITTDVSDMFMVVVKGLPHFMFIHNGCVALGVFA